jgi:hypothetical protein
MPLQATSGAASYDAFGGGAAAVPNYIEDVFSTWLYTGNGSTQTITNGIDLAGKGGLVWLKARSNSQDHGLFDTARGQDPFLSSNRTAPQSDTPGRGVIYNSNGFTNKADSYFGGSGDGSGSTYASWTFREQPKFFDVVTWTANGSSNQEVSHSLASVPGCIIVKRTDSTSAWSVWHRKNGLTDSTTGLSLNTTGAATEASWNVDGIGWISSTMFKPASGLIKDASGATVGTSGTYVAYLFAHNAGGFGLTGTDNVISCGSFTTDSSGNATVDLGYEPQYLLIKRTDSTSSWLMFDTMRGLSLTGRNYLLANTSGAEVSESGNFLPVTATGFQWLAWAGASVQTWAYIAIRRGPMKVPTTGTSVYTASTQGNAGDSKTPAYRTTFPVDFAMRKSKTSTSESWQQGARLTGTDELKSNSTASIATNSQFTWDYNNGWYDSTATSTEYQGWMFRRAPGFFDVVCYTGDGSATRSINHNLGVPPELAIFKSRSVSGNSWLVVQKDVCTSPNQLLVLNDTIALVTTGNIFSSTGGFAAASTATTLNNIGSSGSINGSGNTQVAYLFASCPGVSKVGSYTGNGSSQTINCGFTGGARFVMIKRTDNTGDWYVWDTARGIVSGNDPHLSLNTTAAEVTSNDTIDTDSTGFVVNQVSATNVNVSSATYIFMAVA